MSTPEQPATPALTRKQIRELRNTGSTPVITAVPTGGDVAEDAANGTAVAPAPVAAAPAPVVPLPRPAEPTVVPPPPVADSAVDLGVSPLTRRQARQQERIRTASVPVITPEVVAAHAAATADPAPTSAFAPHASAYTEPQPSLFAPPQDDADVSTDSGMHELFGLQRDAEPVAAEQRDAEPVGATPWAEVPVEEPSAPVVTSFVADEQDADESDALAGVFGTSTVAEDEPDAEEQAKSVVSPTLGASLLDGHVAGEPAAVEFPPSFDQLLSRNTGAVAVPNTLIVSQAPEVSPLVAPVTATGEVIVTGTFNLPEGLGSTGHARGTADGKEIDATLVDGELPSHSSPTPIAASAAVSTVKTPGEVIKPPAPEKGGKLMMSLAITAGVLALALVGVLILAFATGVFA